MTCESSFGTNSMIKNFAILDKTSNWLFNGIPYVCRRRARNYSNKIQTAGVSQGQMQGPNVGNRRATGVNIYSAVS